MTMPADVPRPAAGDTDWIDFADETESASDLVRTYLPDGISVSELNATGTRDSTTFLRGDGTWSTTPAAQGAADATTTTKGVIQLSGHLLGTAAAPTVRLTSTTQTGLVQLAGDLGGTATAPTVPGLAGKVDLAFTKRTITTAYTLVAADATDFVLHSTSATAVTITLPQDTAATIAQEVSIPWRQYGAGQITFAAGTGATLVSRGSAFKSAGQYAEGVVTKVAANTWLLSGDISV